MGNPFSTTVQITFEASRRPLAHAHEGDQPLQSWLLNLKSLSAISLKYSSLVKSGRLLPNPFGLIEGVDHRFFWCVSIAFPLIIAMAITYGTIEVLSVRRNFRVCFIYCGKLFSKSIEFFIFKSKLSVYSDYSISQSKESCMEQSEKKKGFLSWYFGTNLLYRILIGMALGIVLGLVFKEHILWIKPFGDLFVRLLKMIVMPIIVSTLITGAASISPAKLGKVGIRVVLLYLLTSAFAVAIGLFVGSLLHPHVAIDATAVASAAGKEVAKLSFSNTLLNIVPTNYFTSIVNEQVLPVIFFSILFGIGVSYLCISKDEKIRKNGETILAFFEGVSTVMTKMVGAIMQYAPVGVCALIATVFATLGAKVIGGLGMVVLTVFIGYALHILIVYFGVVGLFGISPIRFWKEAKNPFLTGFVTRSSYGTVPVTMECCKNLGVPKEVYSFSIPLGATINMDGTAIYQGVCCIFIALSATGQMLTGTQMGTVILTATLMSIGTAGVPGAGAIMLLMVLDSIGLRVDAGSAVAGAYAIILGLDAILDMGRTAVNVTGDAACTACVAKQMGLLGTKADQ